MRLQKGFAAGLAALSLGAAGLAGCSSGGSPAPPFPGTAAVGASTQAAAPRVAASNAPAVAPASSRQRSQAKTAATQALGLYASGQFAAFWNLLAPATKRQISSDDWVSVHEACSSSGPGGPVTVKAVTVFGNAAIVTETVTGSSPHTTEVVFNYVDGAWSYTPDDLSVYGHGSATADVAAAKAAGLCGGWKIF
jgi:hypothetical protein